MFNDPGQDTERESNENRDQMFSKKWGWYISLYKIAGNDLKQRDELLERNLFDFLNHLSFITEMENLKNR